MHDFFTTEVSVGLPLNTICIGGSTDPKKQKKIPILVFCVLHWPLTQPQVQFNMLFVCLLALKKPLQGSILGFVYIKE